ncbi:MAG: hypothetical protein V4456_18125 [Bacteroidota bacterium]
MKTLIGQIHNTSTLTQAEIDDAKTSIKDLLQLDTIEITHDGGEFYDVTTNDSNIVDFKMDTFDKNKISLVKYRTYDDQGNRSDAGANLSSKDIKTRE